MTDQLFMRRALELARLGSGDVIPNPMVGCVIVHEGKIIGEGYHEQYGGPHAEVNAIHDVTDDSLLSESTVYVTLEPCSHYGKTPPCADLLIDKKVKRVVVCNIDPNPKVSGKGIDKLKAAGIEVEVGVLEEEGLALNKRFFAYQVLNRPYVILKWAQTADGFVARENYNSKWISGAHARQLVHKWRSEEASIMVGTNTAKYDNPSLTVRDWEGKNPIRVVIDRELKLDSQLHLFDGEVETLVLTEREKPDHGRVRYIQLDEINPKTILQALESEKILSVFIEGGAGLLQSFIDANLWDEARVFTSETRFDAGIKAPTLTAAPSEALTVEKDALRVYKNQ